MKKLKSIQVRFTLLFVCVFVAINLACYAFITQYLDQYYFTSKCKTMKEAYQTFVELAEGSADTSGLEENQAQIVIINGEAFGKKDFGQKDTFHNNGETGNIELDPDEESDPTQNLDISYETIQQYSRAILEIERQSGISVIIQISKDHCLSSYEVNTRWMMTRLLELRMKFRWNTQQKEQSVLEMTEDYVMQYNKESTNDTNYLDMWGSLSGDVWFLMSMPMERVQESTDIASRFYLYTGIAGLLIGTIVIIILMKRAVRPINELTDISQKMSDLDFEAKYQGETDSELGHLGQNMNNLSERLEETMGELKKANLELKNDIDRKTQLEQQRTEFISNVSHELKTPIALIQGYAEGLVDGVSEDPENMQFYCDVILDESKKMNRLVLQLLSLNQIEAGNQQLEVSRFDITELLKGAVAAQELLMKQNNAYIILKPQEPIYVWGDEYKIEEVVMNYLSNAWNHLAGKKQIIIDVQKTETGIRVMVQNTGNKIPEEDLGRIWEKFYKVDKARTREYGGHGIGLSIVKAIIERHDGTCGAYNVEDGVVFWFELKNQE